MKTKAEKHLILKKSVTPRENLTTSLETKIRFTLFSVKV